MLSLAGVSSLYSQNWFMLMLAGEGLFHSFLEYMICSIVPPGDVDANLNLPDMVIDIFTLSVKCYLIICYDQIPDVFNLISNHYGSTYHDNIGSYFYFSLFTTESIVF